MSTKALSAENVLKILTFLAEKPSTIWREGNTEKPNGGDKYLAFIWTEFENNEGIASTFLLSWTEKPRILLWSKKEGLRVKVINNLGDSAIADIDGLPASEIKERVMKGIKLIQEQFMPGRLTPTSSLRNNKLRGEYLEILEKLKGDTLQKIDIDLF